VRASKGTFNQAGSPSRHWFGSARYPRIKPSISSDAQAIARSMLSPCCVQRARRSGEKAASPNAGATCTPSPRPSRFRPNGTRSASAPISGSRSSSWAIAFESCMYYRRYSRSADLTARWGILATVGSGLSGLLWGCSSLFLLPDNVIAAPRGGGYEKSGGSTPCTAEMNRELPLGRVRSHGPWNAIRLSPVQPKSRAIA
jgi:hypothetical protein